MSNTLLTSTSVIHDAALMLSDKPLIANLTNRSVESEFAKNVGDTVKVSVPSVPTASAITSGGTTSATDVTETSKDVVIQKHFYVRHDLTADDLRLSVQDFNIQFNAPAISGLVAATEEYILRKIVGGFNQQLTGTAGNEPSTHAHILAGRKKIFDNKGNMNGLVAIIDSTAANSFYQLDIFANRDYGEENAEGLRKGYLTEKSGITFFTSPYAGTFDVQEFDDSSTTATTLTTSTSVALASLAEASGTISEGTQFSIAGVTGTFTVTKDATIASNAATVVVDSTPDAAVSTAAVTAVTAPKENVIYNPAAVACAILPGSPGPNAAIASINGMGLRIIQGEVSTSTTGQSWVWDLFVGARVVKTEHGATFCG